MILVTGGTGKIGSQLILNLVAKGVKLRAIGRNSYSTAKLQRPGVEVFRGDLEMPDTLGPALTNVETMVLITPMTPKQDELQLAALQAAKKAGVKRIVKVSGLGAAPDAAIELGRQHGRGDQAVINSGLRYTLLKPAYFMQNFLAAKKEMQATGKFHLPFADGRLGLIDSNDIAAVAAAVVTESGHDGKVYDLTGPQSLNMDEVAAQLSEGLRAKVEYADVPLDTARQAMVGNGMPDWQADLMLELFGIIRQGYAAAVTDHVEKVLGRAPRTVADFARANAKAFLK